MARSAGLMGGPPGAETTIGGRRLLYFGGTGYFGLQGHPELIRAGVDAFRAFGTHGATSRAGFGGNPVLDAVEARLAGFFGTADAAYFSSGYLSILILTQTLGEAFDAVFADECSHFCIGDAAATLGRPVRFFRHRDPGDLEALLRKNLGPGRRPLVLSDGVFAASGRIAPLPDYRKAVAPYGGLVAIDDAHGAGVLGARGRGTTEHFGLKAGLVHVAGTLSKAFGGHGGFILGSRALVSRTRSGIGAFVGSTPPPTPVAAASARGLELLAGHPEWRERLRANVALAKAGLRGIGIDAEDTPVPIVSWSLRTAGAMKKLQAGLLDRGIAVPYLKYPGTPPQGALRIAVFSTHTPAQIGRLIEELGRLL